MITLQYLHVSIDLWGAFFCLIAIISILIGQSYDKKGARLLIYVLICSMLLMISDVTVWVFSGREGEQALRVVRFSTYATYFFGYLNMPLVTGYLTHLIVMRSDIGGLMWKYVEWVISIIGIVLITINLTNGFMYGFDRTNTYLAKPAAGTLPGIIGIFGLLVSIGIVLQYYTFFNRFEQIAFISYLLLPLAAIGLDLYRYRLLLTVFAIVISSLLLYFSYEFNSREYRSELEKSLADQQIRMFHQQIQPHFIFNSLSVIKYQSRKSPDEAIATIDEFADYLRACSDMMASVDCVPVERELDLVNHYIYLQKKRFGEHIDYRSSYEDTDFEIPPFTLQTLVENAFTHGLRGRVSGNEYISLKTFKRQSLHVIEIEDNGAGFDTRILENNTPGKNIGIRNTKDRIQMMCGGYFYIESAPGKGTKVTITIPESRKKL